MRQSETVIHPLEPVVSPESEILILGSFPSVKSRETAFYYGHPQNRFWRVLAAIFGEAVPQTNGERRELILRNRLALWDTVASCRVCGSADSSLSDVTPNDLSRVLGAAPIRIILLNGKTAAKYFFRFQKTDLPIAVLPSTSPANAAWSLEKLIAAWRRELEK